MLNWITKDFVTVAADIDESPVPGETPGVYCERISREKALRVASGIDRSTALILSGDTTVSLGHQIIGKPESAAHAIEMLQLLSGKEHLVTTAITLCQKRGSALEIWETRSETLVKMNELAPETIQAYVASGDPMGKAGAYAIQNPDFRLVESIQGCYAGVIGLPLCHCGMLFKKAGEPLTTDSAQACRSRISYNCTIDICSMLNRTQVHNSKK